MIAIQNLRQMEIDKFWVVKRNIKNATLILKKRKRFLKKIDDIIKLVNFHVTLSKATKSKDQLVLELKKMKFKIWS